MWQSVIRKHQGVSIGAPVQTGGYFFPSISHYEKFIKYFDSFWFKGCENYTVTTLGNKGKSMSKQREQQQISAEITPSVRNPSKPDR